MANGYNSSLLRVLSNTNSKPQIKQINSLVMDNSDMATVALARSFRVTGTKGAQFKLIALQNPASSSAHTLYYDWKSKAFESGHNNLNNDLTVSLSSSLYNGSINFPSGGGEFVIKLMPINDTLVKGYKSSIITKTISKVAANTTVTFAPRSASSNYATQPTKTSVGFGSSTDGVEFDWDVTNISNDSHGFGLRLTGPYKEISNKYWYFEATENVVANGSGTDGADTTTVTVASTADLCVGMELTYYKTTTAPENNAGSAVGLTTIRRIGTAADGSGNFTITFSQNVGFDEGQTMTFRAYGSTYIKDAIGLDMAVVTNPLVTPTTITKTVRGDISNSQTINLNGTYGIAGGNLVKYTGVGVDNSSANAVTSVSASSTAGSMTVQANQTLSAGTVLTFEGCNQVVNFKGDFRIYQYPTANKNIYLDLDKLITVGAGS